MGKILSVIFCAIILPATSSASKRSSSFLQSQQAGLSDIEYRVETFNSAAEMQESLAKQAKDKAPGQIIIDAASPQDLEPIRDGLKEASQTKRVSLVVRDQVANFVSQRVATPFKEKLTQWVTVSVISGTAFVSWYFVGHAELSTSSILTAWTFINAVYFNVMINFYHKTIDSSIALWKRLIKKSGDKWTHRYRHLSLYLMSIGINTVTLSLINWHSLESVITTSPFYLTALKNATLGYLASDLWTAVFNRWKEKERFNWKSLRYMSYVKNVGLTFVLPLMMLEHFSGYVGTGLFILSGALFNTNLGEKILSIDYTRPFQIFLSKGRKQLRRKKLALRCETATFSQSWAQ